MQFEQKQTRIKKRHNNYIISETSYPTSLQLYTLPPNGCISLKDFDNFALERLKVLRTIERLNLTGQVKNSEEWLEKLYLDLKNNRYFVPLTENISANKQSETETARHKDLVSHFILRLAYCRTEELRRWLITQETDLFRARFTHLSRRNPEEVRHFMKLNNLNYVSITEEEKRRESENLFNGSYSIPSIDQMEGINFYKVPFTEALELVRSRKCFLKDGYAYVPETDVVTLVSSTFRSNLSKALVQTNRALPQLDDDDRLMRHISDFDKRYTGSDYNCNKKTGPGIQITAAMIDQLANKSFPLCMRQMNDTLRSTHHLRHGARQQYGLFLKGAGLKLEEALSFWRSHFTKNMDLDKFEKQYAYNIRHNYGQEGKRTNYTPYSCIKIITNSVGPGDAHGCPFKHTDASVLKQRLINFKVPQQAITEIQELVSKSHYQIACQKYWEVTHNQPIEVGINHPNQYFEASQSAIHGTSRNAQVTSNNGTPKVQVKTQRSVMYSSQDSSQVSSNNHTQDYTMAFDDDLDMIMDEECQKIE